MIVCHLPPEQKLVFPVVTMGNFDGVHRGHRKIIAETSRRARQNQGESIVLTFDPHPEHVLFPGTGPGLLTTRDEKIRILEATGLVDILWILPFTKEIAKISAPDFFKRFILHDLQAREIVFGHDHRFGRNAEGDFAMVQNLCRESRTKAFIVEAENVDGEPVSSTWIRKWISHGEIGRANALSGHPYLISGKVVHGKGRGRQIGFPTINIDVSSPHKLIPCCGVYGAAVLAGEKTLSGALYVGTRPTLGDGPITVEVHLIDFNGDFYGKEVVIYVLEKIRDDIRFANPEELIKQIGKDVEAVRIYLNAFSSWKIPNFKF